MQLPPSGEISYEKPTFDDDTEPTADRRIDLVESFLAEDDVYPLPNVRRRRQNEDEQARLLSQSAFSRISETLGALNTVGSFLVNITRGANVDQNRRGDMQLISSSAFISTTTKSPFILLSTTLPVIDVQSTTEQSVPDAILTLTKNVLGQNMTKTIEPLIKRVGTNQKDIKETNIEKQTLNEKIDMAALAEKKRKKHQAINPKKETTLVQHTYTPSSTVSPGK